MEEEKLAAMTSQIRDLLVSRVSARGATLARCYRSVHGLLPRSVRHGVETLIEAETMAQSPRLRVRLDQKNLERAAQDCIRYLEQLPEGHRRLRARKDLLADVMLKFAVVIAVVITLLSWRGFV